jgi:hypothetical protein
VQPRPDSDGNYGRVEAVNMTTREVVWTERNRASVSSSALATAGGVIFNGSIAHSRAYAAVTNLVTETFTPYPSEARIRISKSVDTCSMSSFRMAVTRVREVPDRFATSA